MSHRTKLFHMKFKVDSGLLSFSHTHTYIHKLISSANFTIIANVLLAWKAQMHAHAHTKHTQANFPQHGGLLFRALLKVPVLSHWQMFMESGSSIRFNTTTEQPSDQLYKLTITLQDKKKD